MTYAPAGFNFFSPDIFVFNDTSFGDEFEIQAGESPSTGLTLPPGVAGPANLATVTRINLADPTGAALSDTGLPASLDLAAFSTRFLGLTFGPPTGDGGQIVDSEVGITLTSLTPVAVPEPSTMTLSGLGLLCLIVGARFRAARRRC